MGSKKFEIIIVGAGVAGLTAAIGLQKKGHKVLVLERHADTQALGGPINLAAPATLILTHYGLEEIIQQELTPQMQTTYFRRFDNGKPLRSSSVGTSEQLYGSGAWTCSRFGFQKVFRKVAEERGVQIRFFATVQSVDFENAVVLLGDGSKLEADLVIGADGVGSMTRPLIIGDHLERRNPVGGFNVDVPLPLMLNDPDLATLASEAQNYWVGPGGSFVGGVVQDLGVYNGIFITEEKLGKRGEWFVKGDLDQILNRYKDWDHRLLKFLKLARPDDCYVWNVTDLPPLPTWSKGRAVLIGDAAHATLPFLGLGATTGIEDGACLAECLDRAKDVEDIPRVLKAFEKIRRPRVEAVIKFSRENMNQWHLRDGEAQIQRDTFWSKMDNLSKNSFGWDGNHVDSPPTSWTDPLLQPYFRGHKTVEFTNRRLDEMGA